MERQKAEAWGVKRDGGTAVFLATDYADFADFLLLICATLRNLQIAFLAKGHFQEYLMRQNAPPNGDGNRLCSRFNSQLVIDVGQVGFHRALGHAQLLGDLFVAFAAGYGR